MSITTQNQKIKFKGLIKLPQMIFISVLLMISSDIYAQSWSYSNLTRGKLWSNISNSLRKGGDGVDPGSSNFTMDYPGYSKGADFADALNYLEAGGFAIYGVKDGTAQAYTVTSVFYPSSQYVSVVDDEELVNNFNFTDPSIPAEQVTTGAQLIKELGLEVAHKSMVWSIPRYESFIIHEISLINNDATEVSNVHFGMRYGIRMTERSDSYGDEKYGWDEERQNFYFYDDRSFQFEDEALINWNFGVGPERGDFFDARDIYAQGSPEHELDAPGFFSSIVLDAAGGNIYQNILEYLGQDASTTAPIEDKMLRLGVDDPARYLSVMTHDQPRGSWDDLKAAGGEGGNKYEREPEYLVSCGPYTIGAGETVKLVYAEVIGEMDRAKIVAGGVQNIDDNKTLGLVALQENIDAAKELYNNNYVPNAYPPSTPTDGENSLSLTPIGDGVKVSWPPVSSSYQDPLTGQNDLAGYKVYRSNYFTIGPWTEVADIPVASATLEEGNVVYTDDGLPQGVGVYYTVTSYDTDGNESGKVNNNRQPVYPLREANDNLSKQVYVVPNPFRQHSRLLGSGEQYRIEFINVPSKCNIKIYTMVGDLVKEIQHDDGSGAVAWGSVHTLDYMLNDWMLSVAPGIYIFRVENKVDGQSGDYIGKFAIIK